MSLAHQVFNYDKPFRMRHGGVLEHLEIVYETWGELSEKRDNAVLIYTGLSPSAHVSSSVLDQTPGWWEDVVGPGKSVDTDRYFVICFNSLGSCFGTTGPASIDHRTGERYRLSFPVLSLDDIAHCGALVLDYLNIDTLHCAIGPSMGGMTALAFCMMYPTRVRHLISISSACRAVPYAIALRSLQREMICADPNWQQGNYTSDTLPASGMALARKLGMITYRSAAEWDKRFGRERISQTRPNDYAFSAEFEVESYLSAHAAKFIGSFDPNCYLYLSRAMDVYDAADHGGSLACSFELLKLQSALVVGVETDVLFPPHQQQELADLMRTQKIDVTFRMLESIQGHDSFLVDMDRFRPVIADYLHANDPEYQ